MNPVLILTHNNLHLTKRCIESVRQQDIATFIYVWDNGSTDGTREWLDEQPKGSFVWAGVPKNKGVTHGWNRSLSAIWNLADHCLVVGNDTILAPWTYSELLSYDVPLVTGMEVNWMAGLRKKQERRPLEPGPDFSCVLMKRDLWDALGPFWDDLWGWCSDCDYDVRAHRAGIKFFKAFLPYYHERSSTLNLATPEERKAFEDQANKDRARFKDKYGCEPGTPQYAELFR